MKILLISSFLPYPLLSGGNIRLYNILKYLQKNHEVVLVCEKRSYQKEADIKRVESAFPEYDVVGISAKYGKNMDEFYESLFKLARKA